jgi:sortase (surface protein transpeptidase)
MPDTGSNQPTRLIMPEIGLDAAIEPADIRQTPAYNVGWWPDSAWRGDVVLFGHNYAALAPLVNVQPGQRLALESASGVTWYTVTWLETRPANGNVPNVIAGQVVLITCWPFPDGTAERLIVYAQEAK